MSCGLQWISWFNCAARKPFDVEALFDNCLKKGSAGIKLLDKGVCAGLEPFVQIKMKQLMVYNKDCKKFFLGNLCSAFCY